MNEYSEMKQKQHDEFNSFPLGVAFSNKQFKEMMEKWNLSEDDADKIYSIGSGCFIRKADAPMFDEMMECFEREKQEAINADVNGDGFIFSMFIAEMANHEFDYTGDLDESLDACGFTLSQVLEKPNLKNGLKKALKYYHRSPAWYLPEG